MVMLMLSKYRDQMSDNKHEAQGSIFVRFGDELFR